jgi:hypothetical protein
MRYQLALTLKLLSACPTLPPVPKVDQFTNRLSYHDDVVEMLLKEAVESE